MKICAIVVTYFPNYEETVRNILQFLPWIDHLIIWDNTPKSPNKCNIKLSGFEDKVTYMGTGKNEGISYALNKAISWSVDNGYTHLLTMDQDSYWENFEGFKKEIEQSESNNIIYAPLVNGIRTKIPGIFITSGMVVPLNVYNKIGGYCEKFKVDAIDYEFCIRCATNGIAYSEIEIGNLIQKFGASQSKKLFRKNISCPDYNAVRLYDTIKNTIIILKSYKISKDIKNFLISHWIIKVPIIICLMENNKCQKLIAIFKGALDGIKSKKLKPHCYGDKTITNQLSPANFNKEP